MFHAFSLLLVCIFFQSEVSEVSIVCIIAYRSCVHQKGSSPLSRKFRPFGEGFKGICILVHQQAEYEFGDGTKSLVLVIGN